MNLRFLEDSGRYAIIVVGVVGLVTSVQTACTFDSPPPAKRNPVTDSGPEGDGSTSQSSGGTSGTSGTTGFSGYYGGYGGYYGGYGYGYGVDGCYGYQFGYYASYYSPYDVYGGYGPHCD